MHKFSHILASASVMAALATAGSAYAASGQHHTQVARLTMAHARRIALKAQPGTLVSGEREHEAGGSGLRYSFDIRSGKLTHEVGVDAKTGKLLENSIEGAHAD
jgi:uncharacterized membrane protein YkoI